MSRLNRIHPLQMKMIELLVQDKMRRGRRRKYSRERYGSPLSDRTYHVSGGRSIDQPDAPPIMGGLQFLPHRQLRADTHLLREEQTDPALVPHTKEFADEVRRKAELEGLDYTTAKRHYMLENRISDEEHEPVSDRERSLGRDIERMRKATTRVKLAGSEAVAIRARERTEQYRREGQAVRYQDVLFEVQKEFA